MSMADAERAVVWGALQGFLLDGCIFAVVWMVLGKGAAAVHCVITLLLQGTPGGTLLMLNVAGAVGFLEVRIRARQHGMSSVAINLWMMLAFAVSVLYSPWDLNGGMAVGIAMMIGSVVV